jgi:hypothetical protein
MSGFTLQRNSHLYLENWLNGTTARVTVESFTATDTGLEVTVRFNDADGTTVTVPVEALSTTGPAPHAQPGYGLREVLVNTDGNTIELGDDVEKLGVWRPNLTV